VNPTIRLQKSLPVESLIHAGRLDEAEQAAHELLVRYPEVHDGYDRLGMVHEARGQFREAANCYRLVIEFARANAANYDAGFVDSFLGLIAKLEASAAEAERAVNDADRSVDEPQRPVDIRPHRERLVYPGNSRRAM